MRLIRFMVLALCLDGAALLIGTASADCRNVSGRPSIGLALSGGGARGAAHVGVLKVLEELNVPIDCIAGTSMGAIVGGLYAGGSSAEELETVINSVDWEDAFRDDPARDALSFRRKQDDYDFLADFDVGLREGSLQLPLGVVQGQKLGLLLRSLNTRVRHITDFDQLPIPFRAVATDAVSGKRVVLGDGDLSNAQRASMAAPGVFAPVEIDGRILIDGGISNNLPIDTVRSLGADIIIAVDISFPLLAREDLDSAIAMSNQALTILMRRESSRQIASLGPRDIAIVPKLGLYGSADFSKLALAIDIGTRAAREKTDTLAVLSVSDSRMEQIVAQRAARRAGTAPIVRSISLEDNSYLLHPMLESKLRTQVGQPFDREMLEDDIARLYGLNIFELVDYTVSGEEQIDIRIRARQKSWGPNFLNVGFSLVDDFKRTNRYALGIRYTRTQINQLGGEWRVDLQLGSNPLLNTEFYQPLSYTSRFFIAPRLLLQRFDADFFNESGDILAQYRISEQRLGIDVGLAIDENSELRAGLSYGNGSGRLVVGDPSLESFDARGGRARLLYRYDSLDNTAFPTSGARTTISVEGLREALGADRNRDRASVEWLGVKSRGRTHYLFGLDANSNFGGEGGIEDLYELGGLFNLSGYRTGQLRGQHRALGILSAYRELSIGDRLGLPIYAGASIEAGNTWNDSSDIAWDSLRFGGSAFIGVDTPLGPAYLAYGVAEGGNKAAYFFLGQRFGTSIN